MVPENNTGSCGMMATRLWRKSSSPTSAMLMPSRVMVPPQTSTSRNSDMTSDDCDLDKPDAMSCWQHGCNAVL